MDPPLTWRNRTNNAQTATQAVRTTTSNGQTTVYSVNSGVQGTQSLMSDNNHPNFEILRKAGGVIMGDMYLSRVTRSHSAGSLTFRGNNGFVMTFTGDLASQVVTGVSLPVLSLTDASLASAQDASLISAYAKITEESVMSSEILVDLARTATMLRRPFSQATKHLGRMFNDAQRSYGKTADSIAKANASAWLEYRYGMLPLYLDVNQVIKMFGTKYETLKKRRAVVRVSKSYNGSGAKTFADKYLNYSLSYDFYGSGTVNSQRTAAVSSGVMYEVEPRTVAQELAAQFQLGSSAILPGLWEMTPFSFVADWFFNVGDWLTASNLPPDVRVKGNWTTTVKTDRHSFVSTDLYTYLSAVATHGSWGSGVNNIVTVSRCVNRPLPTLPVMTSRYATVTHALDAAALLLGPLKDLCTKLR